MNLEERVNLTFLCMCCCYVLKQFSEDYFTGFSVGSGNTGIYRSLESSTMWEKIFYYRNWMVSGLQINKNKGTFFFFSFLMVTPIPSKGKRKRIFGLLKSLHLVVGLVCLYSLKRERKYDGDF